MVAVSRRSCTNSFKRPFAVCLVKIHPDGSLSLYYVSYNQAMGEFAAIAPMTASDRTVGHCQKKQACSGQGGFAAV